jgi:5-oxoprolinase (ATP-hydrolysing) subunit C
MPVQNVLKIHRAAYASIQDAGRIGFEHLGVARAGFSDAMHAELANVLVGNTPNTAAIEVYVGAFEAEFLADVDFATAGACAELFLAGQAILLGSRVRAKRGQRLTLKAVHAGRVWYLALAGGVDVLPVMGSCSTDINSGFGGFAGRLLRHGDTVAIRELKKTHPISQAWLRPNLPDCAPIRLMLDAHCPKELSEAFCNSEWRVSVKTQRSGMRLESPDAANFSLPVPPHDGVSRGVVPGIIQLPPGGLPIVLGVDAQTVGGYFVLGCVISADLWRIAQAVPGTLRSFIPVTLAVAQCIAQRQQYVRAKIECAVAAEMRPRCVQALH